MSEETQASEPKRGVGTVVRQAIRDGCTNQQALDTVKKEFPDSATSIQTISWYRTDMRKKGEKVPTAAQAKKAAASDEDASAE